MSSPFVAEIRMFAGNFAPRGWALCNGQIIAIAQNTALFSLLGTTYGGNGTSNFALPNLQGRVPIHSGQGPGLSNYVVGETAGVETVTLLQSEITGHSHTLSAEDPGIGSADQSAPGPTSVLAQSTGGFAFRADATTQPVPMNQSAVSTLGGGQPHNNLQPYLAVTFIIALQGVFPARN